MLSIKMDLRFFKTHHPLMVLLLPHFLPSGHSVHVEHSSFQGTHYP